MNSRLSLGVILLHIAEYVHRTVPCCQTGKWSHPPYTISLNNNNEYVVSVALSDGREVQGFHEILIACLDLLFLYMVPTIRLWTIVEYNIVVEVYAYHRDSRCLRPALNSRYIAPKWPRWNSDDPRDQARLTDMLSDFIHANRNIPHDAVYEWIASNTPIAKEEQTMSYATPQDRFTGIVNRLNSWLTKHVSDIRESGEFSYTNAAFPRVSRVHHNSIAIVSDEDEKWTLWFSAGEKAITRIELCTYVPRKDIMKLFSDNMLDDDTIDVICDDLEKYFDSIMDQSRSDINADIIRTIRQT